MIKNCLALWSLIALVAASATCVGADVKAGGSAAPADSTAGKTVVSPSSSPAGGGMPAEITFASSVGEVVFLHRKHIEERSIPCASCHHQINAKKLDTPHPHYLTSSWINCKTCHDGPKKVADKAFACSGCHQTNPRNIADETLSAKVVTHRQCWQCHPVGTAKDASASCKKCHAAKKNP